MAKKLLGPWNVLYPVNFYSGGDTTRQAFGKHIQEITRIYGLLNALDAAKAGSEEIFEALQNLLHNSLKGLQGGSATERFHLTQAQVDKLNGAAAASDIIKIHNNLQQLQGGNSAERYHLTAAQVAKLEGAASSDDIIKQHNNLHGLQGGNESERYHMRADQVSAVMGLMAISDNTGYSIHNLLAELQGGQGGRNGQYYHLTKAQLDAIQDIIDNPPQAPEVFAGESLSYNGYIRFTNGLILQWGKTGGVQEGAGTAVTFPTPFAQACFNVVASAESWNATSSGWEIWQKDEFIYGLTRTGFMMQTNNRDQGGFFWQAIGK